MTSGITDRAWARPLTTLICGAVLCIILTLGLWPFHAPRNAVSWLGFCNGLTLGRWATAISVRDLPAANPATSSSGSVEIWLRPERIWSGGTFLSFYSPGYPHQLSFHQSLTGLEIRTGAAHAFFANVFRRPLPIFLTITAGASGTTVYGNGEAIGHAPYFQLHAKDFAGRLILGDSPAQPDSWSGQVLGLAVYLQELTPMEVRRHFDTWTRRLHPQLTGDDRNTALYLFDERAGNVVHDRGSGADLHIPERYQVVDKVFLEPFWKEFSLSRSYWDSAVKNIVGFLPFGFCFYPSLLLRRFSRPAILTVILGVMVSLTIEILQAYLPTRDSGMTDVFTNTLGTWLGVVSFRALRRMLREYQHG